MHNINTINDIRRLFIIIFEQVFITIFKWTNPLYILLTPFAYIARLTHQVPILLNAKIRNKEILTYNKYKISQGWKKNFISMDIEYQLKFLDNEIVLKNISLPLE